MAAKMLRYAPVGPTRVAVIHIGCQSPQDISRLFAHKSKYFNSWRIKADGGMVIAKSFLEVCEATCAFPLSQTSNFN
ncbi:MAG TPA: hypothetical protein DC047_19375 [Blastocatellia bacterium]|nr:hypothetical protein [Blastocatellia bacterium]